MSAAATSPSQPAEPSRSARLLSLIRKLINYGRHIATTLQNRPDPAGPTRETRPFGTHRMTEILACIRRGLERAGMLEARVVQTTQRIDAPRRRRTGTTARAPRPPRPGAEPPAPIPPPPTPGQIAARLRRRPIGAVLADICRDLGIRPDNPLWEELSLAIVGFGGNLARLVQDLLDRAFPLAAQLRAMHPITRRPTAPPAATGPPGRATAEPDWHPAVSAG